MTKSQIFKAAHKLAKCNKAMFGGDYVVYLSLALKAIIKNSKRHSVEKICSSINKVIESRGGKDFITRAVKVSCTHGLKAFSHTYKLERARKQLPAGQFFGKVFEKNGEVCAWVRSTKVEQQAY